MRSEGDLGIFRSALQLDMLGLILLNADREWLSTELVGRLDATPASVHRELQRALRAGVVIRKAVGRTFLYRAATDSPLFEPLLLLLERTVGVEARLREALADIRGIDGAFIHGSFAKRTKIGPRSDVDVLILGDIDVNAVKKRLRDVERRVGREVDLLTYTKDEFASLARSGNSFARGILRGPLTPVVGTVKDLRKVA